jgi:Flp pilus assembly protein TadD
VTRRQERGDSAWGVAAKTTFGWVAGCSTRSRRRFCLASAVVASAILGASCGSGPSRPSATASLVAQGIHAESTGHSALAAADFRSAAAENHSDAAPYFELGVLYQRHHSPNLAATAYKRALSIKPTYKRAMFNLAVVDTPTQPQAAMNLYNELLLRNPRDAQVDFNLGLLLISQQQPTPGHALLQRAVTLKPALARQLPTGITP